MSCGLPVVSTDCPYGPRVLLEDGVSGFLIPAGHEQEMADKISLLIKNPDMRKQMGAKAHDASLQYNLEDIISRWMELFRTLIAEKKQKDLRPKR